MHVMPQKLSKGWSIFYRFLESTKRALSEPFRATLNSAKYYDFAAKIMAIL